MPTHRSLFPRTPSSFFRLGMLLSAVLGLITACSQLPRTVPTAASTQTTLPVPTLKPPDTEELVSPICASVDTTEVTIRVNADMPSPRCVNVQPNQYLRITNHVSETVRVRLAGFDQQIAPNESASFVMPLGQYLAPGIHFVWMSRYGGNAVELWLTPTRQYVLNK